MIQETHPTLKTKALKLKSYVTYKKDKGRGRSQGTTESGDVMTLVKDELQHRLLEGNLTQVIDDTTDALGISVKGTEQDLKCNILYILPIRRDSADDRTQIFSKIYQMSHQHG